MLPLLLAAFAHAAQHLRAPFSRARLARVQEAIVPQAEQPASAASAQQFATDQLAYFAPSVSAWESEIRAWSAQFGLSPQLVAIVMQIESCGDPQALSSAGARGLFQVMPFHFGHTEDAFDPEVNARRGLDYLATAWDLSGGDLAQTLAAYNGGLSLIGKPASAWPDETRRYVAWGLGLWRDVHAGALPSPTLDAWLAAGGQHLCTQAQSRLALP